MNLALFNRKPTRWSAVSCGKARQGRPAPVPCRACQGCDWSGSRRATATTRVGPSGCGKTTLLRVIAGLEQVDAGQVVMDGQELTHLAPRDRDVGMVFQSEEQPTQPLQRGALELQLSRRRRTKQETGGRVECRGGVQGR
ncbi:MAG: ABC transporter ATP-binding protein, partial [Myxococcus sp.]|nr:ABC transporter ATP-binding protein [Myxococcus sp.]